MKILLTGASGQLGRTLASHRELAALGQVLPVTRDATGHGTGLKADLGRPAELHALLDEVRPDIIINAAAYTAVDRAEREEALATRINGESLAVFGRWAAANGSLVVHYSTDYVFDGNQDTPYIPEAPTAPLNAYGRSKLVGERALAGSGAAYLILRTSWVYAAHGNNFLQTMLRLGSQCRELRVVADQYGAPTSTTTIARATCQALARWLAVAPSRRGAMQGIHHLVAGGHTSWHGFAEAIFAEAAAQGLLAEMPRVTPIATIDFPRPAKRPAWSVLDTRSFRDAFDTQLPAWQEALAEVVATLRQQGIGLAAPVAREAD